MGKGRRKKGKGKGSLAHKLKRDYLRRELEYGRLTMSKCMQNWKQILITISKMNLEQECLSFWHLFERGIDYKDLQISLLMDWIEDDMEIHRMSISYHCDLIDYMIYYFQTSYRSIYDKLATQVNDMIYEWTNASNEIARRSQENEKHLSTMIFQLSEISRADEYEDTAKIFSYLDERRGRWESTLQLLKALMHSKIEKLYQNVMKFVTEYLESTRKKKKLQGLLYVQNEILGSEIKSNKQKLLTKKQAIQGLIEKFEQVSNASEKSLNDHKMERDKLNECFLTLKKKLCDDTSNDNSKRCLLISGYNEIFKLSEARIGEGTLMIKCLKSCRKYETLYEKLYPYPVDESHEETKIDVQSHEYGLFWNKVASVSEIRLCGYVVKKNNIKQKLVFISVAKYLRTWKLIIVTPNIQNAEFVMM